MLRKGGSLFLNILVRTLDSRVPNSVHGSTQCAVTGTYRAGAIHASVVRRNERVVHWSLLPHILRVVR